MQRVRVYEIKTPSRKEILRYAGAKAGDAATEALIEECLSEVGEIRAKACYAERDYGTLPSGELLFGDIKLRSESLKRRLDGCDKILLFAVTVGIALDRLMRRYTRLSPARALIFSAIGSAAVEDAADMFSRDMQALYGNTCARFSPGYGDLPLELTKEILAAIDAQKWIGVSANESCLMSPTKSVSAIIGIKSRNI